MGVLEVMTMKLAVLAMVAGLVAQRFKSVSLALLVGVVLASNAIGGFGELLRRSTRLDRSLSLSVATFP